MHDKRRDILRALLAAPWLLPTLDAGAQTSRDGPAVGSRLRLPDLPLLEGGTFTAKEAEGKVLVMYWWASWCPFCAEMSPDVEKLWRAQKDNGMIVLGVSIDRTAEAAIHHRRKRGYTFPSTIHDAKLEALLPKPKTVPTTWVRARDGRVATVVPGQMFPEDVAELAKYL